MSISGAGYALSASVQGNAPASDLKGLEQLRAGVSLSCLSAVLGRLCLLHTMQILPGWGPTMSLSTDYTKSITSSQLYASGGWAVSLIKVNTTF